MKQYIIDALQSNQKVILTFGKEDSKTFNVLIDSFDSDSNLIELGQKAYNIAYLVNLEHVQSIKISKTL